MQMDASISRRQFIKKSGGAIAALSAMPAASSSQSMDGLPNIVFIICDQMRGDAMGCAGDRMARTPHLDRMAEQGIRFRNFFSNSPVCAPSRVSFFTGLYPHQHGKLTNRSGEFISDLKDSMLGYFRAKGYRLGWVGKNHTYVKDCLEELDTWKDRGREPFRAYSKYVPPHWHSDTLLPEESCYPGINTDDSIEFINQAKQGEPFFLHVSYFDPHPPYMAPSEYTSQYCSRDMKIPDYIDPAQLSDRLAEQQKALHYDQIKESDLTETLRYYYAAIEYGVDKQVGRILDALEQKGMLQNTIVVFTSDHGDFMGHHHMVRKGMFLYDHLLHIPFIMYAPGRLPAGEVVNTCCQSIDLYPTLVEMTGGKADETLPGRSMVPFVHSEEDPERMVFASAKYSDLPDGYWSDPEPRLHPESDVPFHTRVERITWKDEQATLMIRNREWKMILNESRKPELYHMNDQHTETRNVVDDPGVQNIRKKLKAELVKVWNDPDWKTS